MTGKTVLAIGLDPHCADLGEFPEITPELVEAYIEEQIDRVRALGYDVECCLIDRGETAEQRVEDILKNKSYDCIVIGAGLREPSDLLLLFERILNVVHRLAPESHIAFNSTPADTAEAVERWLG
jgi:hypothetical protein